MTALVADRIDIGLCTFRRPQIVETLASLSRLSVPDGMSLHVIVADNDTTDSARARVMAAAQEFPHGLTYLHAPAGNISIARNACLDAAQGRYMAFIDDDETATPGWIAALLATARQTGAAATLGPVKAHYTEGAPGWMRKGDLHSTLPVYVGGAILTGYTCNVLLDRAAPSVAGRRFDLSLGRSGGEDTAFFTGMVRDGGRIVAAPDALVEEVVPPHRASFRWLAERRFRMGQTHGRIVIGPGKPLRQAGHLARALAKGGYCAALAAATCLRPEASRRHALRGALHVGVVAGLLGVDAIERYGLPTPRAGATDAT